MSIATSEKVKVKLFVGCLVAPDIRMALHQSSAWKHAKITPQGELTEQRFQSKDYLGILIDSDQTEVTDIVQAEATIRERLNHYCPGLVSTHFHIYLLPIVLVT